MLKKMQVEQLKQWCCNSISFFFLKHKHCLGFLCFSDSDNEYAPWMPSWFAPTSGIADGHFGLCSTIICLSEPYSWYTLCLLRFEKFAGRHDLLQKWPRRASIRQWLVAIIGDLWTENIFGRKYGYHFLFARLGGPPARAYWGPKAKERQEGWWCWVAMFHCDLKRQTSKTSGQRSQEKLRVEFFFNVQWSTLNSTPLPFTPHPATLWSIL